MKGYKLISVYISSNINQKISLYFIQFNSKQDRKSFFIYHFNTIPYNSTLLFIKSLSKLSLIFNIYTHFYNILLIFITNHIIFISISSIISKHLIQTIIFKHLTITKHIMSNIQGSRYYADNKYLNTIFQKQ